MAAATSAGYHVFSIVAGSTQPSLVLQVTNTDGSPFDLTGYTVQLDINTAPVTTKTADLTDAAAGKASFAWQASDFVTPNRYLAQLLLRSELGDVWKIGGIIVEVVPSVRALT